MRRRGNACYRQATVFWAGADTFSQALRLGGAATFGVVVYLLLHALLRMDELGKISALLFGRVLRKRHREAKRQSDILTGSTEALCVLAGLRQSRTLKKKRSVGYENYLLLLCFTQL